ncbi:MAG: HAD family hydrolase [bacterium]|nr:HAD family hydrolase [bacterium]
MNYGAEHIFKDAPEIRGASGEMLESGKFEAYTDSELIRMLDLQADSGEPETALCVDIDNTFHKKGYEEAMRQLTQNANERHIPIIAVTGNGFEGVLERINSGELPPFAGIAGAVGTELWILHRDATTGKMTYKKDTFFENTLREAVYDRLEIVKKSELMIRELSTSRPNWQLNFQQPEREEVFLKDQNAEHQPFKTSFHFFASPSEIDVVGKEIHTRFPGNYIVICEEINHNRTLAENAPIRKYCIDILPIGKSGVITYLSKLVGIKQGIVAGDSGNDIEMLTRSCGLDAVLVGGHTAEAASEIHKLIHRRKDGQRSFQRIVGPDGIERAVYVEPKGSKRQAAESILRAVTILRRTRNIKRMQTENQIKWLSASQ